MDTIGKTDDNAKLALVSFDSLGDGLIYLMIANNLQRNGFDVTCYGNVAHQMRHWLPSLKIRPYPHPEQMETELSTYDLALVSPPSFVRDQMDEATTARLREKWLLICQKTPQSWVFDHTERIRTTHPGKFGQLQKLLNCSGSIRFKNFAQESVVEMTLQYMQEKMHLDALTKEPSITPPAGLQLRRHRQRIIVSPDSAGPEKKNWRPSSFLKLCHRLRQKDYSPEIVVAPKNHALWEKMSGNEFHTPRFDDIGELCAYFYESGALVANDSGNGHLASFLGIPVVTLYRKRNPLFHWRPDWKSGIVICPKLPIPLFSNSLWKYFISVPQIIAAVDQLQARENSEFSYVPRPISIT